MSEVFDISHTPATTCRALSNEKTGWLETWTYSCAAMRIRHQPVGVTKQVRHTIAGASIHGQGRQHSCFRGCEGEALLLWHRGVSAYLPAQTICYKGGWPCGRRISDPQSVTASHRDSAQIAAAESCRLCLAPLATLLTRNRGPICSLPRGFYGCWRDANPGHRLRACHTSNDVLGLRQPSKSERSKQKLASSICRNRRYRQLCDYSYFVVCLPVPIAAELINGG